MPFKRVGRIVYKQVGDRWVVHARAKSERNAQAMLRILDQWMERLEKSKAARGRRSSR